MAHSAQPGIDEPLPPPKGYVAEKLSLLTSALAAALRSLGLRLKVADDSTAPAVDSPVSTAESPAAGPRHPILQEIGATVDRNLQDAATAEPQTRQLLLNAMQEERIHAAAPSPHKI